MKNRYYTISEIYKIDYLSTKKYGIPSIILMELAGKGVFDFIRKSFSKKSKIIIFCGPGKNGGDGFVLAKHLFLNKYDVSVVPLVKEDNYKGDELINLKILKNIGTKIINYKKIKTLSKYNLIVDAIFGIGLNRKISGKYFEVIKKINNSKKCVISIDIPSGINGDSGEVLGIAVKSSYTLTIGFLKKGFKNKNVSAYLGKVVVLNIGYPEIDFFN